MGSILSRRIAGVEDIDIQANSAYRYPPKSGELPRARTAGRGLGRGLGTPGGPGTRRATSLPCRGLSSCAPFSVPVESEAWLRPWPSPLATVAPCAGPFLTGDLAPVTSHSLCVHPGWASLGSERIVLRTASRLGVAAFGSLKPGPGL